MGMIPTPATPSQMPESFKAQAFSLAYIRAIAAKAGANIYKSEEDFGVDMSFCKIVERNGRYTDTSSMPIPFQIKASKVWTLRGDAITYDLEVKNYNDIINSSICVLILMCLPPNSDEWLSQDEECLRLHKCCYYWRPSDLAETLNTRKKRISISKSQIFTVNVLTMLMDEAQARLQL
ncbi:MAG TPA: DUF4365 domain-containing protein [Ktedonobacteraceae bacterium]|nr:DUF4365 domain-containing protein [Ktedonobacteraceae bacterium]